MGSVSRLGPGSRNPSGPAARETPRPKAGHTTVLTSPRDHRICACRAGAIHTCHSRQARRFCNSDRPGRGPFGHSLRVLNLCCCCEGLRRDGRAADIRCIPLEDPLVGRVCDLLPRREADPQLCRSDFSPSKALRRPRHQVMSVRDQRPWG